MRWGLVELKVSIWVRNTVSVRTGLRLKNWLQTVLGRGKEGARTHDEGWR
jgi:hypothetical protein